MYLLLTLGNTEYMLPNLQRAPNCGLFSTMLERKIGMYGTFPRAEIGGRSEIRWHFFFAPRNAPCTKQRLPSKLYHSQTITSNGFFAAMPFIGLGFLHSLTEALLFNLIRVARTTLTGCCPASCCFSILGGDLDMSPA